MPPPSRQDVADALLAASRALVGVAVRSIPDADVTLAQLRVLVVLERRGDTRPGDLAAMLGVSPSSATRLCDRLARRGFLSRVASGDDRREVLLSLTARGRSVVRGALRRRAEDLARLASAVAVSDRAAFVRGCLAIDAAVDADSLSGTGWLLDAPHGS